MIFDRLKNLLINLCFLFVFIANGLLAQTVVFTKADLADWTLEENQDRITDNVWITRKHTQSLFNIAQEDGYSGNSGSPVGTLWADTTTTAAGSASYTSFVAMHGGSTQSLIGNTVSLYLPQDGLYFDVTFLSFSGGNSGGGFSYSRTAVTTVFTKADSADWTLPENQDRITDNVWITRKHSQSLFNIAQEDGYSGNSGSPVGTLWADTTTTAAVSASYTSFVAMHGGSTQSLIGNTVSLYLPQDGLYFDVTFLSFSGGNSGGGFSYSRTAVTTSVEYKFINGNDWDSAETVPDDCATGGNRKLDVPNFDRTYEVCFGMCELCPAPDVYSDVVLTVVDDGNGFQDVEFKGVFSGWALVQAYDDGTNGDETSGDGVWTAVIDSVLGPASYEWGAIENDGSEWGIWLLDYIGLPNQVFTVEEDGSVSGSTSMTIPDQGSLITKIVVFSVDMTEWLDEDGATGMPVFSVARGDTMQVRGGFNGWNCDDPTDCVLTRTPGTNIFSLAVAVEGYIQNENEYKFYIQHSMTSVSLLEEDNGEMYGDMGWEDSPQFGGGNRVFVLGEDDGTDLLELPLAGYYDLPVGAVVPEGQEISVNFRVDMTGASEDGFNAAEDSVYLKLEDKWLKYLQGIDDNHKFAATNNGDGSFSVGVDLVGPVPWHMIYHWEFLDVSESVTLSEGGGFGFGRFRARYMHSNADYDCSWGDYGFPDDVWQKDPPLLVEEWDPDGICIALSVVNDIVPTKFALSDNYPNPFNPTTNISFSIPMQTDVQINIYNIMGQLVANVTNEQLNAGTYSMQWNGTDQSGNMLPSGLYFYELEAGNEFRQIKKMTLVK